MRGAADQRKKHLSLFLNAKWALEVKFIIEKKRINRSLADLAAEAVVQNILIEEEVEELDIPECLFPRLRTKFADIEWLRSYWSSKEDLEEPEQKLTQEKTRTPAEQGAAEEPELPEVQEEVEDVGPEQAEEFLSSVIEELSDVEQIIGGEVGHTKSFCSVNCKTMYTFCRLDRGPASTGIGAIPALMASSLSGCLSS